MKILVKIVVLAFFLIFASAKIPGSFLFAEEYASGTLRKASNASIFLNEGTVTSMLIDGNNLYVAMATYGLYVFDITNPLKPLQKGQPISLGMPTAGMVKVDKYLYISDNQKGIALVDVSSSYQAKLVGSFKTLSGQCWDLVADPSMRYLYVATGSGGVETWNIVNRFRIRSVGQTRGRVPANNVISLYTFKDKLFIGDKDAGLLVLSAKNPEGLVLASTYRSINSDAVVRDIMVDESNVYMAMGKGGFEVLNHKEGVLELYPKFRVETGSYSGVVSSYARYKKMLFLGSDSKAGFRVYNTATMGSSGEENEFSVNDEITSIAQADHILYVGTSRTGVVTLEYNMIPKLTEKIKDQSFYENDRLEYQLPEVIDLDDDYFVTSVRMAKGSMLPKGFRYTDEDGFLEWETNLNQEGRYDFVLRVEEEGIGGITLEYPFRIMVLHSMVPPKFPPLVKDVYVVNEGIQVVLQIPEAKIEDKDRSKFVYRNITSNYTNSVFDERLRRFSWTPSFQDAGTHEFRFEVYYRNPDNRYIADTTRVKIVVNNVNRPPKIGDIPNRVQVREQENFLLKIIVSDDDVEDKGRLVVNVQGLPKGSQFDPKTLEIKWLPSFVDAGDYLLSVNVSDLGYDQELKPGNKILTAKKDFILTVGQTNRPPVLTDIPAQFVVEGKKLEFQVSAKDPDKEDVSLEYLVFDLPSGASFSSISKKFEWIPTFDQAGKYSVRVRVKDFGIDGGIPKTDEKAVNILVENVSLAPKIEKVPLLKATENEPFKYLFSISDPDREDSSKLIVSLSGIPQGADFNKELNELIWTPNYNQSGIYNSAIEVIDPSGLRDKQSFSINVANVNRKPVFNKYEQVSGKENVPLELLIVAKDEDKEDVKLSLAGFSLPTGAKFLDDKLIWTPSFDQAGVHECIFVARDNGVNAEGKKNVLSVLTDTLKLEIKVDQVNRPPMFVDFVSKYKIKENQDLFIVLKPADLDVEDRESLVTVVDSMPVGMTFDPTTKSFSWRPTYEQSGVYTVGVKLTDSGIGGDPLSIRERFRIEVDNVNRPPSFISLPENGNFSFQDKITLLENETWSLTLKAEDPDKEDNGKLVVKVSGLPLGATFDDVKSMINWIPNYDQAGNYKINVEVFDQGLDAVLKPSKQYGTEKFVLDVEVKQANRPPVLAVIGDKNISENKKLSFILNVSDPDKEDASNLSFKVEGFPAGAEFNEKRKEFTWVPNFEQSGDYRLTFVVTDGGIDGKPLTAIQNARIIVANVNRPPVLEKISKMELSENEELSLKLAASDPDKDRLLLSIKSEIPVGMRVEGSLLRWTPNYDQAGQYKLLIEARDDSGAVALQDAFVYVKNVNRPPKFSEFKVPEAREDEECKFSLIAEDLDKEDKLEYSIENLPTGAVFKGQDFKWKPNFDQAGTYKLKLKVVDLGLDINKKPKKADALKDEKEIELVVKQTNRPPKFEPLKDQTVDEMKQLSFEVVAIDPDPEDKGLLKIIAESLPTGATFDGKVLKWTPSYEQAGEYAIKFKAIETFGSSPLFDEKSMKVKVNNVNRSPLFVDFSNKASVKETESLGVEIKVSDPDTEDEGKLKTTVSGLPVGATFDGNKLKWVPNYEQAGTYSINFEVVDQGLDMNLKPSKVIGSTKQTLVVEVKQTNRIPVMQTIGNKDAMENKKLSFVVNATDPDKEDAKNLKFSVLNIPNGANFNEKSREFAWTPTYEQSGSYDLTFKVIDGGIDGTPLESTQDVTISVTHVNRPPSIAAINKVEVNEGEVLLLPLNIQDPDKEDEGKLSLSFKGTPPSGVAFEGLSLQWKPDFDQSNLYRILIEVKDPAGLVDSKEASIYVKNVNRAPKFVDMDIPQVRENEEGATLKNNEFRWKPTFEQYGNHQFTVKVLDLGLDAYKKPKKGAELFSEKVIDLSVKQMNRAPFIEPIKGQFVSEGKKLEFTVSAKDLDAEDKDKLIISADKIPLGATFKDNIFTWEPNYEQSGQYDVVFTVTDSGLDDKILTDTQYVKIRVNNTNRPPVFLSFPEKLTVNEMESTKVDISVSDPDKEDEGNLKVKVNNLPKGASFDEKMKSFQWEPNYEQAGLYKISVDVFDQGLDADLKPSKNVASSKQSFEIEVKQTNRPPSLKLIGDKSIQENKKLQFKVSATDLDKEDFNKLVFRAENLPDGATFNSKNGEFLWTPSYEKSGSYKVTFYVDDSGFDDKEDNDKLSVSVKSGLVEGMIFNGTKLTWFPTFTQSGTYKLAFEVKDALGLSDAQEGSIFVKNVNRAPKLDEVGIPVGSENSEMKIEFSAKDPDPEDRITYSMSDLPKGATFSGQVFRWKPTFDQAGEYKLTVTAKDLGLDANLKPKKGSELFDSKTVILEINKTNRVPEFETIKSQILQEGKSFSIKIKATDPDVEDKDNLKILVVGKLPLGASFDGQTFTWEPNFDQAGEYEVNFSVSDSDIGGSQLGQNGVLKLVVENSNRPPSFVDLIDKVSILEGDNWNFVLKVTDPDKEDENKLRVLIKNLPKGAAFDESTLTIKWLAGYDQSGQYGIDLEVMDQGLDKNLKQSKQVKITKQKIVIEVKHVNRPPFIPEIGEKVTHEEELLTFKVTALDPDKEDNNALTVTLSGADSMEGYSFKDNVFSWKPKLGQKGDYEVVFTVKDKSQENQLSYERKVKIRVDKAFLPPVFKKIEDISVPVGESMSVKVEFQNEDKDDQFELLVKSLPTGAEFDPVSRTISWKPTKESIRKGAYNFSLTATNKKDLKKRTASTTFSVRVLPESKSSK
ncbi:hypothetical protein CHS0354_000540 [Potamilus streckersoni]|uniref:Cadherin domain-containing protein n=1 Tax=Potamilus streckersoni TaxID=2493646 RepID=A0AAE0W913_9BIVA|nr:hypothetical protein CHS0354_000540 [Potamilus streckersoni]